MDTRLEKILSMKRPTYDWDGNLVQDEWAGFVRDLLPAGTQALKDRHGNLMAFVFQQGSPETPVLFSCHVDTVHNTCGVQTIVQNGNLAQTVDGECLGADDGAGLWLLLSMIDHGVPGAYIFHFGEEVGCIGSRWMAHHRADWLQGFDVAISFDRPNCSDVVTHLCGKKACDDEFAAKLSLQLNAHLPTTYSVSPSAQGGMTDIYHYIGLIKRCTNISVGYTRQHSPNETLDVDYLMGLRDACLMGLVASHEFPRVILQAVAS